MSSNHCWFQLICIFINFGAVVCTLLVILSAMAIHYDFEEPIPDILRNGTIEVDSVYPTPISPSSWIHVTWLVAYTWMLVWSGHVVISTCRRFAGVPVYVNPSLVNTPILLFSIGACGMTVSWFCVYDREYISTATLFAFCVSCFAWTAYILSVYTLHTNVHRLEKGERMAEVWLHRLFVQNGLAILGMWTVFVTALNLCTALIHNKDVRMEADIAAVVAMSALAFYLILYVTLDITVMDRFSRYTCFQYLVPIVVLCACIFRQDAWPSDDAVFILLATLLAFSFLQIMLKAACVACRIMTSSEETLGEEVRDDNAHLSSASSTGYLHEGHYLLRK